MKTNLTRILIAVVLLFSVLSCNALMDGVSLSRQTVRGSGQVVEENRSLGDISRVSLEMPGTLHIEMGDSESLRVEAEQNLMEYIQTDVQSSELKIRTRPGINLQHTQPIHYYLTVDELDEIAISSSGDVEAGNLQSESLSAAISSSGNMTISELVAETINVRISSSGNLSIAAGEVQQQNISISSSGDYDARNMPSSEARVTLSSSGSATVRVSDHLSGGLSSSGDIYYLGDPEVDVSTSSSGRPVQVDE